VLEALEATALATWLRHSTIAYPIVSATHIMAIGTLVGAVLLMDVRLLGGFGNTPLAVVTGTLEPLAAGAFAAAALSGGLLFAVGATEYVENSAFRVKAVLLALALANVAAVRLTGSWPRFRRTGAIGGPLAAHAAASLVLWIAVLFAGRFVGFV